MMNLSIGQLDLASPRNEGYDSVQCFLATGLRWQTDAKMPHFLKRIEPLWRKSRPTCCFEAPAPAAGCRGVLCGGEVEH